VNTRKDVFYCHGCGQGGDLIRFVQLSRQLSFRQSLTYLDAQRVAESDSPAVLVQAAAFYQQQLDRYPEAMGYLNRRAVHDPVLIRELGIGYAPGGSLRRYLTAQGYGFDLLRRAGLITAHGADALYQRIVFPLGQGEQVVNLYGRSIGAPFLIASCPATRAACMAGRRFASAPRSSWWRACSTMRYYGRQAFTT
jgi:DNA primase